MHPTLGRWRMTPLRIRHVRRRNCSQDNYRARRGRGRGASQPIPRPACRAPRHQVASRRPQPEELAKALCSPRLGERHFADHNKSATSLHTPDPRRLLDASLSAASHASASSTTCRITDRNRDADARPTSSSRNVGHQPDLLTIPSTPRGTLSASRRQPRKRMRPPT